LVPLLPEAAFDLVKIDVEGHEGRVLRSMFAAGRRPRQLLLEFLPGHFDYGIDPDLPSWLRSEGYAVRTVTGDEYRPGAPLPDDNLWASRRPVS
jgi:hypothetical protein